MRIGLREVPPRLIYLTNDMSLSWPDSQRHIVDAAELSRMIAAFKLSGRRIESGSYC